MSGERQTTAIERASIALLILLASALPAAAWRVRPHGLDELTARANRIFAGRCTDVTVRHDAALETRVTQVTFAVERAVKGAVGPKVVIRLLGTPQGSPLGPMPRFTPGDEVVLFLDEDSAAGLTSPVGQELGVFAIVRDKSGRRLAINRAHDESLFRRLSPATAKRLSGVAAAWGEARAVPPDTLLDLVELLVEDGRTNP